MAHGIKMVLFMEHFIVSHAFLILVVLYHGIFTFYHGRMTLACKWLDIFECFHGDLVGKPDRMYVQVYQGFCCITTTVFSSRKPHCAMNVFFACFLV